VFTGIKATMQNLYLMGDVVIFVITQKFESFLSGDEYAGVTVKDTTTSQKSKCGATSASVYSTT